MQKTFLASVLMMALITSGCASVSKGGEAKKEGAVMQKITGLKTPESVVQAKNGKIYVSEINGFGKAGDGQITVIENGKARVFAKGLDDPKGLVIIGDYLYVADNPKVLRINLNHPEQVQVFAAASAFPAPPMFLNDLEADIAGNLYVSDSGDLKSVGGAIYKINPQGKVTLLINHQQDARILAPNGLLMDDSGDVIMVVDFASGVLYSYNMKTKVLTDLAEGFGGADGLVHHSNGKMFVSDWKNGKVFSINMAGDVTEIKSGYQSAADIALTKDEKYLMVPDMKAGELDFIPLQ
ncbi:SMP-30/gluconolaconase/LRE-like region [mine drainage metagenome]|uniref:SMP-30/gluconolaconase/LRE-like region n=1 Tax=mine drainage metagenome TaxID=410659 RepID=A0A1J5RME5_9ZZZZ